MCPWASQAFQSAPPRSKHLAASPRATKCNGVDLQPLVVPLGFAPALNNTLMESAEPADAARCNARQPWGIVTGLEERASLHQHLHGPIIAGDRRDVQRPKPQIVPFIHGPFRPRQPSGLSPPAPCPRSACALHHLNTPRSAARASPRRRQVTLKV